MPRVRLNGDKKPFRKGLKVWAYFKNQYCPGEIIRVYYENRWVDVELAIGKKIKKLKNVMVATVKIRWNRVWKVEDLLADKITERKN
jgi:hypothetical protein